jgi:hypothetical protein
MSQCKIRFYSCLLAKHGCPLLLFNVHIAHSPSLSTSLLKYFHTSLRVVICETLGRDAAWSVNESSENDEGVVKDLGVDMGGRSPRESSNPDIIKYQL